MSETEQEQAARWFDQLIDQAVITATTSIGVRANAILTADERMLLRIGATAGASAVMRDLAERNGYNDVSLAPAGR